MARKEYVYKKSQGFVRKKTHNAIDYEQIIAQDPDSWQLLLSYFRWYPDRLDAMFESEHADFTLTLPQCASLRYMARYQTTMTFATRGYGKTFDILLDKMNEGVCWVGSVIKYVAPTEKQAAPLASQAYRQICKNYPILAAHWYVKSEARDNFCIATKYGSSISIDSNRGYTCTSVVAEECGQEDKTPFDWTEFRNIVAATVRKAHVVNKQIDPTHLYGKKDFITSPSRQQNESFAKRREIRKLMLEGKSAYAIDIPWQVPVLSYMKPIQYYMDLRATQTPEEFMRECEAVSTGTSQNPVIRDSVLTKSRTVRVPEFEHCGQENVLYIICHDVALEDDRGHAMCATGVIKCERNSDYLRQNRFSKSLVNIFDYLPPANSVEQARKIKQIWAQYCKPGMPTPYICIDSIQYGKSVLEAMHSDLGDGYPPLCCMKDEYGKPLACEKIIREGALPVIYPIHATGGQDGGTHDPDGEMIRYAENEFEQGNVHLLTPDIADGMREYKLLHKIKTDEFDSQIFLPYFKTKELCGQVTNLQKKLTGMSYAEIRISKALQRDLWSCTKYGLRLAYKLEQTDLLGSIRRDNPWEKWGQAVMGGASAQSNTGTIRSRCIGRNGGNSL